MQAQYIQAGTYLLLEKLTYAVHRRLLKKCALAYAALMPGRATQLPLLLFQWALAQQGVIKDDDEVQCLVANLIYRKYVKGYIAFKSRVLVLSKVEPFPPLDTVALADPSAL